MAEAGTTVFAATAALARSNRAVSESTVNHLHEGNLATAFAKEAGDDEKGPFEDVEAITQSQSFLDKDGVAR